MSNMNLSERIKGCFDSHGSTAYVEAFDREFRPFIILVLASMCRIDTSLIDDAYQSALVKYIQVFRSGRREGINYEAYFVAIAKNCLIDEFRARQMQVQLDQLPGMSNHSQEDREAARITILQAMMRLNTKCRFVLENYYITGLDSHELARLLGIKQESVPMTVKRCRESLKKIMEKSC